MKNIVISFVSAALGAIVFYSFTQVFTPNSEKISTELIAQLESRLSKLEELTDASIESMPPPGRIPQEEKIESLSKAGFDPETVQFIIDNELDVQKIIALSEQTRQNPRTRIQAKVAELQAKLGEEGFAKYLDATGRESSAIVETVLPNSIASVAGILPQDRIVRYAGKRVYGVSDLKSVIAQTPINRKVMISVSRDETLLEMEIEVGELGVAGARGITF